MAPRTLSASRLVPLLGSALETTPAYRGLADALRLLIVDGRVPVGTRLPSERDLTRALGVSRTTISRAYAELRERGFLSSRQGSGSVTTVPRDSGSRGSSALEPVDGAGTDVIDLTCASMTAPPGTAAAYEAALAELPAHLAGTGYHPHGLPALRALLAERYTERGLPTTPDQLMVTSGALAGIAITARALLGTGDRVLLENPTYPNAIEAVRRTGARLVALPVGAEGWDVQATDATVRQTSPRVAYLVPDFHNPTGALMDEATRASVGESLTRSHTVAVVDETLADLAHDPDQAMPRPFAAFHPQTILVGGASKTFWGGLRIGWIRAPRDLMATLLSARLTLDLGAPVLEQLALAELLRHRVEVVAHRRERVVANRDHLVSRLREALPQWTFGMPRGGLCLWVTLPLALSTSLCAAADRRGLALAPGAQFAVEGTLERFLRLPFAGHSEDVVDEAVARLAAAWEDVTTQAPRRAGRPPLVA